MWSHVKRGIHSLNTAYPSPYAMKLLTLALGISVSLFVLLKLARKFRNV